eukprot:7932240-Pyramimonas_sp.AAC.1
MLKRCRRQRNIGDSRLGRAVDGSDLRFIAIPTVVRNECCLRALQARCIALAASCARVSGCVGALSTSVGVHAA